MIQNYFYPLFLTILFYFMVGCGVKGSPLPPVTLIPQDSDSQKKDEAHDLTRGLEIN